MTFVSTRKWLTLPLALALFASGAAAATAAEPAPASSVPTVESSPSLTHEGHHGHGGGHRANHHLQDTADALGISSKQLIDGLKQGKSIAQIGKEKGITEDQLVTRLLDKEKTRIKERINRTWKDDSKKNT